MTDNDQVQNAFGMTPLEIAEILRGMYYDLLGSDPPQPWEEMPHNLRARWGASVEVLFLKCERGTTMSARLATEQFYDSIVGEGRFTRLPRPVQLVWEAILRHAINLITAGTVGEDDDRPTPRELRQELDQALEYDWEPWLAERAREEGLLTEG